MYTTLMKNLDELVTFDETDFKKLKDIRVRIL